jgi:hypothetical protein
LQLSENIRDKWQQNCSREETPARRFQHRVLASAILLSATQIRSWYRSGERMESIIPSYILNSDHARNSSVASVSILHRYLSVEITVPFS